MRRWVSRCAAVLVGMAGAVVVAAPARAEYDFEGLFKAVHSGKYVVVKGASAKNDAPIIQHDYTTALPDNDWWWFDNEGNSNWYRIRPTHVKSGGTYPKCMVVKNASKDDYAPVIQHDCTYGDKNNDVWLMETLNSFGEVQWRNLHSNKCLAVRGANTRVDTPLIQFTCDNGAGNKNDVFLVGY